MMNQKIMAIIKSDKGHFLLLKTNPKTMKQEIWWVVTGGVEKGESEEDAVRREIEEGTQLEILKIEPTDYFCEYEWPKDSGKMHHEKAFLVRVKEAPVKITRWEHLEYKWLNKVEFLKMIDWEDDIKKLQKMISKN